MARSISPLLEAALAQIRADVDRGFEHILPEHKDQRAPLIVAMRYAAIGGGKRLRPLLVVSCAGLFHVDRQLALRAALAIEAIHVYSLIHDDLPAMDDDRLRHGKPCLHLAFDEAVAILAGDALQALAFELLSAQASHEDPYIRSDLVRCLSRASGMAGMVAGQIMDLIKDKSGFDLPIITRMQQLKTGALITAAVEMGAILGGASDAARQALGHYAQDIGLAFQIADDLLDVEGDAALAGKALGKDAAAGKRTFVSLMGVEQARAQARFLIDQAKGHLQPFDGQADILRDLADYIIQRKQ